jgi:hypothetical protein
MVLTATCPAGTAPTGCTMFPNNFCATGWDRVVGAELTATGCEAEYDNVNSECGALTITATLQAQCINIP